jgi:hypothetical protein
MEPCYVNRNDRDVVSVVHGFCEYCDSDEIEDENTISHFHVNITKNKETISMIFSKITLTDK